MQNFKETGQSC